MVYKFRILSDEVDNFVREIAIDSEASFLDLHNTILESVGYSKDQITSFFTCNEDWEKETEITLIEMDSSPEVDSWIMESTRLSEFVEDEGQKLLYVFDYLTERSFFIEAFQFVPNKNLSQPKCILSEGEAPKQNAEFEEPSIDLSGKINIDEEFYGDQDFDIDELDADGFSGLEDIPDPTGLE
jgi:predicted metalloprotease with PDZ domain